MLTISFKIKPSVSCKLQVHDQGMHGMCYLQKLLGAAQTKASRIGAEEETR